MPNNLPRILAAFTVSAALGSAACGGAGDESGNHPPVALDEVLTIAEDTPIEFDALANERDPDGDQLTVTRAVASGHEVKIISGRRIAVTSPANFNGQFELSYTVSDGLEVADARAIIAVTPVNDAPAAAPVTVATGLDLPVAVALMGTDVDGDTLTYELVTKPSNGTLSGTAPALTYTPRGGFYGADVFNYRVRDAAAASAPVAIMPVHRPWWMRRPW
jgi:large repetitive protein